jgi:hypothetical protein
MADRDSTSTVADLAECRELLGKATTERSRRLLQTELAALEDEHRGALSAKDAHRVPAAGDHRLTSYAWDQSGKFVKCARPACPHGLGISGFVLT